MLQGPWGAWVRALGSWGLTKGPGHSDWTGSVIHPGTGDCPLRVCGQCSHCGHSACHLLRGLGRSGHGTRRAVPAEEGLRVPLLYPRSAEMPPAWWHPP